MPLDPSLEKSGPFLWSHTAVLRPDWAEKHVQKHAIGWITQHWPNWESPPGERRVSVYSVACFLIIGCFNQNTRNCPAPLWMKLEDKVGHAGFKDSEIKHKIF